MDAKLLQRLSDLQVEEALLGAVLIAPSVLERIVLPPDAFVIARNQYIWEAIVELKGRGENIDLVTVSAELGRRGRLEDVGGSAYLAQLAASVPSSLHAQSYASLLAELAWRRRILRASERVANAALNLKADPGPALKELEWVAVRVGGVAASTIGAAARQAVERALELARSEEEQRIVYWGVPKLNKMLFLEPGNFVVVGARPSVGKTALLLTAALETARRGQRVVFVSLEMTERELGQRAVAQVGDVSLERFRRGRLEADEWNRVYRAVETLDRWPLHLVHVPGASVTAIQGVVESVAREHGGLAVVFVDYLGLIVARGASEYERTTAASKDLQRLAKSLERHNAVLVVAHQLSRAPEQRADKRPTLADLRNSGQIEQDVDVALLMWKPEEWAVADGLRALGIHAAKVRQGEADWIVRAALQKRTTRVVELSEEV